MSGKTTLQDQNIDVDLKLVSLDKDTGEADYVDLDLSSVTFFEINDNLLDIGLTGNITYPSWNQLFESLDINAPVGKKKREQFVAISLSDLDSSTGKLQADEIDTGYDILARVKSDDSLMPNIIDVKKTVDFEEDLTASLKHTAYENVGMSSLVAEQDYEKNKAGKSTSGYTYPTSYASSFNVPSKYPKTQSDFLNRLINEVIARSNYTNKLENRILDESNLLATGPVTEASYDRVKQLGLKIPKAALLDFFVKGISCFDLIQKMYGHFILREGDGNVYLPLLKTDRAPWVYTEKDADIYDRVIKLKTILTPRHFDFIKDYTSNTSGKDYSDVYMEEFSIAPDNTNSNNSSLHNKVETYDYLSPDLDNLKQTKWGAYSYDKSDGNVINNSPAKPFEEMVEAFEKKTIRNKSNLPNFPIAEQKKFYVHNFSQTSLAPGRIEKVDSDIIFDRIANIIARSFIFLNESIVFTVKGRLDRRPGKFITVKGKLTEGSRYREIWLVTSVKHRFISGDYKNEITAVRFLSEPVA